MKADLARQLALLDLQAVDTRLDQIRHASSALPQHQEVLALQDESRTLDTQLVNARTALSDVQREVDKAEADVQLVRDRAARDQARLDAGTGSAKDLQAIQHELTSLARRQSELEDIELEVMEHIELMTGHVAHLEGTRDDLKARLGEATATRDEAMGVLASERDQVADRREGVVAQVGEDLMALYERVRASSGGIAAATLTQRRCGGCHMELNQVEINRITKAPVDEVLRCEECGRIMVRTAESGLLAP
ncbi:MAG: C4-type zinc ribbon domain-containing protein [Actinomycetota bacterium]|nr:C4-type zinc ribbon domain-containing protein [Actinomycetota bacterium]